MNRRKISIFLIILMLTPMINSVQADGSTESDFEAKNLEASVDSIKETVTLTWNNVNTTNYLILEELKSTNYTLYRSDEPLNSSNYQQTEKISDSIQACLEDDTFGECKDRVHSVVYNTPANTNGTYYYGVISTLEDGSVISNFSIGNGTLSEPVQEFGSPISSPYYLQASYNIQNATTHLSWIDISQVDSSINSYHNTTIWSHSVMANISNWETLNKVEVVSNLSQGTNSYTIIHPPSTSRVSYYTVLHSFNNQQDSRLVSGNTLTQGITEDNIGSSITGTLNVNFNNTNSMTALVWNGSVIEDANHTLHIWRSSSPITDISADGVEEISQLAANSTHYNYTVVSGYSGQTYYLITLSDELGNQQTDFTLAPKANLKEFTLEADENIVTDLTASYSAGTTTLTWTDLENHSEATYQIWSSTSGQINETSFGTSSVTLLQTIEEGIQHYNHTIEEGISQKSWYAITVIASFGTQNLTSPQSNITLSKNALLSSINEDHNTPTAPSTLNVKYQLDGSTELTWTGDGTEQGTIWHIYRSLYSDVTEESFWVKVSQKENNGASLHMVVVDTVAQEGEVVTAVYAIGAIDLFGNDIDFEDWTLSSTVVEDREAPKIQLKLYDSDMKLETSRWFNGGEEATFSNLEAGSYTVKFSLSDDSVLMNYSISTNVVRQSIDLTKVSPEIEMSISQQVANITISFTVFDLTGNSASVYTNFCTSCLIESSQTNQTDANIQNEDNQAGVKSDKDSNSNINILIAISSVLVLIGISLMLRGPKQPKTPSGLPTKSEDSWFNNYIK